MILPISCAQCGVHCGSYDPGHTTGSPENCYPAEYVKEPDVIDDDGNEFCSQTCAEEYALDHTEGKEL